MLTSLWFSRKAWCKRWERTLSSCGEVTCHAHVLFLSRSLSLTLTLTLTLMLTLIVSQVDDTQNLLRSSRWTSGSERAGGTT